MHIYMYIYIYIHMITSGLRLLVLRLSAFQLFGFLVVHIRSSSLGQLVDARDEKHEHHRANEQIETLFHPQLAPPLLPPVQRGVGADNIERDPFLRFFRSSSGNSSSSSSVCSSCGSFIELCPEFVDLGSDIVLLDCVYRIVGKCVYSCLQHREKRFHVLVGKQAHHHCSLRRRLDQSLADKHRTKEGGERHQEMATADAAHIEQCVGPRSHQQNPPKPVFLCKFDHPTHCHGENAISFRISGDLFELLVACTCFPGSFAQSVGRDLTGCSARAPDDGRGQHFEQDLQETVVRGWRSCALPQVLGRGPLQQPRRPHISVSHEVEAVALLRCTHNLDNMREQEQQASVHARPKTHRR
mmetsp:Transcript_11846/g.22547  ORF Transcript_11846/g.22547 Transcript_11846/m.22547 type:complete len:356 (-) Transcript_11846:466-1533(-)